MGKKFVLFLIAVIFVFLKTDYLDILIFKQLRFISSQLLVRRNCFHFNDSIQIDIFPFYLTLTVACGPNNSLIVNFLPFNAHIMHLNLAQKVNVVLFRFRVKWNPDQMLNLVTQDFDITNMGLIAQTDL